MRTARDMAKLAARLAAGLDVDEVEAFSLERDLMEEYSYVTLHLTDGTSRKYLVQEMAEEPGRPGQSHPYSP